MQILLLQTTAQKSKGALLCFCACISYQLCYWHPVNKWLWTNSSKMVKYGFYLITKLAVWDWLNKISFSEQTTTFFSQKKILQCIPWCFHYRIKSPIPQLGDPFSVSINQTANEIWPADDWHSSNLPALTSRL